LNIGYIGIKMGFDKREEISKKMLDFTFMMDGKNLEKSTIIVKKYRAQERKGMLYGPHISQ